MRVSLSYFEQKSKRMTATAQPQKVKDFNSLEVWRSRDGLTVYNDLPDEIWRRIPAMRQVEKFRLSERNWTTVRAVTGDERKGQLEVVTNAKASGDFVFTAKFNVDYSYEVKRKTAPGQPQDVETVMGSSTIIAYTTTGPDGPIPLVKVFSGKEGGLVILNRNNREDALIYIALMMAPPKEGNLLGMKNYHGLPPDIIHIDEEKLIADRLAQGDLRRAADRAYEDIENDLDLMYVLARSMSDNYPYDGAKSILHLKDYMRAFVDRAPQLVLAKIKELDISRLREDIKDALNLKLIENDSTSNSFIFPNKEGNKGIVSYLATDNEGAQARILYQFLNSPDGSKAKAYMRKELDILRG